jgi:hypothetical protein
VRNWNSESQLGQQESADSKTGSGAQQTKSSLSKQLASSLGAIQKTRNLNIFKSSSTAQSNQPEKEKSKVTIKKAIIKNSKEY